MNIAESKRFTYNYRQTDEIADVVRKSKELQDLLARTEKEIDEARQTDKEFFPKLQASVAAIEQNVVRY